MALLPLAVAMLLKTLPSTAGRLDAVNRHGLMSDADATSNDRCTVNWEIHGYNATISFPVTSCLIKCRATHADYRYHKVFSQLFEVEDNGKSCSCQKLDGQGVLNTVGPCQEDHKAKQECFDTYVEFKTEKFIMKTNARTGKPLHKIVSEKRALASEGNFQYSCVPQGCPGGDCLDGNLPFFMTGRPEEEKQFIATLVHKDKDKKPLTHREKGIVSMLTTEEYLYLSATAPEDGNLTVGHLKQVYKEKLSGTGIRLGYMLRATGLSKERPDDVVSLDDFRRFLRPGAPKSKYGY